MTPLHPAGASAEVLMEAHRVRGVDLPAGRPCMPRVSPPPRAYPSTRPPDLAHKLACEPDKFIRSVNPLNGVTHQTLWCLNVIGRCIQSPKTLKNREASQTCCITTRRQLPRRYGTVWKCVVLLCAITPFKTHQHQTCQHYRCNCWFDCSLY